MDVPFFRPSIGDAEIGEVTECLRSGWLTTGPRVQAFERSFADYVGAKYAVAVNSCTAALHLALEAVGLERGELVLVPTMTFAATAEVVRYFDALPVFVDCEPETLCIDVQAAARLLQAIRAGDPIPGVKPPYGRVRAIVPMHYGGQMVDVEGIQRLAHAFDLAVVEDAAHALPAYYRADESQSWRMAGTTADVTCFSFYANKCITTAEGGMAVTDSQELADRMRVMSLHGISKDAWKRYTTEGSWYYEIVAPGFKYNLSDVAAGIGLHQLSRADTMWRERRGVADQYREELERLDAIQLPVELSDRRHAWHLFPIRLQLGELRIDRATFIAELKRRGVGASVHWMPLHLHPYYRKAYGYVEGTYPVAEAAFHELVSLPIFAGMAREERAWVIEAVRAVVAAHG